MKHAQLKELINKLKAKQVKFEHGLSDTEIQQIENKFNLNFPPDLKALLQTQLPVSNGFVNWRLGLTSKTEADSIRKRMDWVFEGMAFDIQNSSYWERSWGKKPDNLADSLTIAKRYYQTYPKMIPICSHRYIPSRPNKTGNPVFSIYQTDIVYYGYDLADYLSQEFHFELSDKFTKVTTPRKIAFWRQFDGSEYNGAVSDPYYRFDDFDERLQLPKVTFSYTDFSANSHGEKYCFIVWEYYLLELIDLLDALNADNPSIRTNHNVSNRASLLVEYNKNNDLEFLSGQQWHCQDTLLLIYNLSQLINLSDTDFKRMEGSDMALQLAKELSIYLQDSAESELFIKLDVKY